MAAFVSVRNFAAGFERDIDVERKFSGPVFEARCLGLRYSIQSLVPSVFDRTPCIHPMGCKIGADYSL